MNNVNEFNIENFIKKAKTLDFFKLYNYCQMELGKLDQIKYTKGGFYNDVKSDLLHYKKFIHEFAYILTNGNKPANLSEDLVRKKQLKPEILKIY